VKLPELPDILTGIAGALTPALLFYAAGYAIIQSYVVTNEFQAYFWFTEAFYREAGVRFLLDIVASVISLPHVFLPVALLMLWLRPGALAERRAWPLLSLAGLCLAGAFAVLVDCSAHQCAHSIEGTPRWFFANWWLLRSGHDSWMQTQPRFQPTALFLGLAAPAVVALVAVAAPRMLQAWRDTGTDTATEGWMRLPSIGAHRHAVVRAAFGAAVTLIALAYVVLAYGTYFYDFVAVPLVDTQKCSASKTPPTQAAEPAPQIRRAPVVVECFLLSRFDDRYVLIGRIQAADMSAPSKEPQTYIWQVRELEPFAITGSRRVALRNLNSL